MISIACPAVNVFCPLGVELSTVPAAEPEWAIVIAPFVTAVPPISKVKPQFAEVIALLIVE